MNRRVSVGDWGRAVAVSCRAHWWLLGPGLAFALFELWMLWPLPTNPILATDTALFQYSGLAWIHLDRPMYLTLWDLKPPAVFELTALLAVLSGPNPIRLHWLSLLTTNGALVVSVILVGKLTYDLTGKEWPSVVTGFLVVLSPSVFAFAMWGVFSEYYVLLFGVSTLLFVARERPLAAAVTATVAAAFYQNAVIFPLVVLGVTVTRYRQQLGHVVGTVLVTTAVLLLPLMVEGAVVPMLNQVIIGSLLGATSNGPIQNLLAIFPALLSFSTVGFVTVAVLGLGCAGSVRALLYDRAMWPYAAVWFWFLGKMLFIEAGSALDTILFVTFSAPAAGLLYRSDAGWEDLLTISLGVLVLVFFVASGSFFAGLPPQGPESRTEMEQIYFNMSTPDTCYVRDSSAERAYLNRTAADRNGKLCERQLLVDDFLLGR